jgi:hypothetical protein
VVRGEVFQLFCPLLTHVHVRETYTREERVDVRDASSHPAAVIAATIKRKNEYFIKLYTGLLN